MKHSILMILLSLFCWIIILNHAFAVKDGLVLYLPFDGDIKDASGNKNTIELKGKDRWSNGKYGKAFEFGGDTHIQVLDEKKGTFDGTPGLTIAVWVKQDTHHDNGIVVKLTSDAFWPCSYNLETWSDQLAYFDVGPDAGQYATASYPLKEWYHLAGVFDGAKGEDRIYINGKLGKANPRDEKVVPDGDRPVCIGSVSPSQYFFVGALDDLVIYNRALSEAEIRKDMEGINMSVDRQNKLSTFWGSVKKERI